MAGVCADQPGDDAAELHALLPPPDAAAGHGNKLTHQSYQVTIKKRLYKGRCIQRPWADIFGPKNPIYPFAQLVLNTVD